jgi:glycosyltransferase involved in cell wall biosynthesis
VDVMLRTPTVVSMDGTPYELMDYVRLAQMPDQHAGVLGRIKHAINRGTYKRAHKIISFNQVTKNSLVNHYGIPADDVLVIPAGIDTKLWQPAPDSKPNDGIVRLLFVGGDLGRKGGDLLLRWARQTTRKNWELHLVTGADAEQVPRVFLHKGLTPNDPRMVALAQRADLFVLPTRADLSPNAILEGKAAGLPSLSTTVGAIHEMVRDGIDGFLTAPGDYAALAERLDTLIDRPEPLREMGARAREMVTQQFDAQKNSTRVIDVLVAAAG